MTTVTIFNNPLELEAGEVTENVTDIHAFLQTKWPVFPTEARIYHRYVAGACDVTPHNEFEIKQLGELTGDLYIVVYPEGFVVIMVIIAVVLAAVAIGMAFLLRPNAPKQQQSSPNNQLSNRQNTNRPNERIPDIVGTVTSTPDLIAVPYRVFVANQEIEHFYGCVGKGSYQIEQTVSTSVSHPVPVWDVKDDTTPLQEIAGSSFAIYGPNTSPNSGDAPQLAVGATINTPVVNIQASSSVNGQILRPPNDQKITGDNNIRATASGTFEASGSVIDFTAYFAVGDDLTATYASATDPGGVHGAVNLSGVYTVLDVTASVLTLSNPNAVNAGWNGLASFTGAASNFQSPLLSVVGQKWVGPWVLNVGTMTEVWANFVAPNGLFKVSSSSGDQYSIDCFITLGITALDSSFNPVGTELLYSANLIGSAILQSQRGVTLKCVLPTRGDGTAAGICRVRAVRTTDTDNTWQGTNADQVQWRDLYAVSPIGTNHFGNVTTIQTMTYATASALSVKSRKLNLKVTRQLPTRVSGVYTPNTNLAATRNAADIIMYLALEPYIGNRTLAEVDVDELYEVLGAGGQVSTYFGTDLCCEFGYTFDDTQVSFEEAMGQIAQAVFCVAFRRGSLLSVSPELQTDNGVLIFNHRNKIPGSETRTITFGRTNDYDGIELDYVDPNAPNYPDVDTTVTLHFPQDQSAVNPKKVTATGVRNNVQASMLGWRLYNKLIYQNTATEFKSTDEAAMLVLQSRILVADNTRADTQDGQVVSQSGLTLTLSQPFNMTVGHSYLIFLQRYDASIDRIAVTSIAGAITVVSDTVRQSRSIVIASAPTMPLVLDPEKFAQTTYWIVDETTSSKVARAFLLAEKQPEDGDQYNVKAVNYDDRYYVHDTDFITGRISVDSSAGVSDSGFGSSGGGGSDGGANGTPRFVVMTSMMQDKIDEYTYSEPYYAVYFIGVVDGGNGWSAPKGYLVGSLTDDTISSPDTSLNISFTPGGPITAVDQRFIWYWKYPPSVVVSET